MKIQIKTSRQSFLQLEKVLYSLCFIANSQADDKVLFFDWYHILNLKRVSRMLSSRTLSENHKKEVAFTIDHNEIISLHHYHGPISMMHPLNEILLDQIYKAATKKMQIELNTIKSRQHAN